MRSNKIKRTRRGNAQRKTMRRKTQKRKTQKRKTQKRKTMRRKTQRRKTQRRKRMRRLRGGADVDVSIEVPVPAEAGKPVAVAGADAPGLPMAHYGFDTADAGGGPLTPEVREMEAAWREGMPTEAFDATNPVQAGPSAEEAKALAQLPGGQAVVKGGDSRQWREKQTKIINKRRAAEAAERAAEAAKRVADAAKLDTQEGREELVQAIVGYGNLTTRGSTRYQEISGIIKSLNWAAEKKFVVTHNSLNKAIKDRPEDTEILNRLREELKRDPIWVKNVSELTFLEVKGSDSPGVTLSEKNRLNELSLWLVDGLEDTDPILTPTEIKKQTSAPRPPTSPHIKSAGGAEEKGFFSFAGW